MPKFWMNMNHDHVWISSCILTVMSDTEHLIQLPLSLGKMFPKNTKSPAKDKTWLWSLSPSSTNSFRQSCLRLSDRPWKSQTKESSEKWNQTSPFPLHGPLLPSWGKRPTVRGICPDYFLSEDDILHHHKIPVVDHWWHWNDPTVLLQDSCQG